MLSFDYAYMCGLKLDLDAHSLFTCKHAHSMHTNYTVASL